MTSTPTRKTKAYVTMKVWLPRTHPGIDNETLTLENPNALHFLLEALAHGHSMFNDEPFDVVAYQGRQEIGRGTYIVRHLDVGSPATSHDRKPIQLMVVSEQGQMRGILCDAWQNMVKRTDQFSNSREGTGA